MARVRLSFKDLLKGSVVIGLAIISIACLYEVTSRYEGDHVEIKYLVLTIFPAAYLWWIIERIFDRFGFQRSTEFSLLVATGISIWIMAGILGWDLGRVISDVAVQTWEFFTLMVTEIIEMFIED